MKLVLEEIVIVILVALFLLYVGGLAAKANTVTIYGPSGITRCECSNGICRCF